MNISIKDILQIDHYKAYNLDALNIKMFKGVSTDSRSLMPSELFFALHGEHYNGHTFVAEAFRSGAACAIVDARCDRTLYPEEPLVVVKDTVKALGQLAAIYRKKFDIPVLAVAGSNGKTTTKEMITSVLRTKYSVLNTEGNQNNHIGVPQTIFRLKRSHDVAVIEIGTNHFGELKYLCRIINPTHGLITNIGREHLEFFKNLRGVARAEGELFKWLGKSGSGLVNADDPHVLDQARALKKKITYGFSIKTLNMYGKFLEFDRKGCSSFSVKERDGKAFAVQLSVPGRHVMMNALAAAAVGVSFGVTKKNISYALSRFRAIGKRMETLTIRDFTVLNDTYNSNPDSAVAALETLQSMECRGNKIIIWGDMLELGSNAKKEHTRIGNLIGQMGFQYLLAFGEMSQCTVTGANVNFKLHFEQKNILSEYAAELVSTGDIVLVKGSRGMKMEDVITFLAERFRYKVGY